MELKFSFLIHLSNCFRDAYAHVKIRVSKLFGPICNVGFVLSIKLSGKWFIKLTVATRETIQMKTNESNLTNSSDSLLVSQHVIFRFAPSARSCKPRKFSRKFPCLLFFQKLFSFLFPKSFLQIICNFTCMFFCLSSLTLNWLTGKYFLLI